MSIVLLYEWICRSQVLNKHFTHTFTPILEFWVRIHSRYLYSKYQIIRITSCLPSFPIPNPWHQTIILVCETICYTWQETLVIMVRLKMNFIFLTLCLLLSFYYDTEIFQVTSWRKKKIISYSIAEETAQLNLIIVWRRKYFQWRHLPLSIDFITDFISVCYINTALSSSFKILILVCCSNVLLVQNTCCKIRGHQIFLWAKNNPFLSVRISW